MAAVQGLERLDEPAAVMPLYELVQNEAADHSARRAAAEALVKFGLLRRERTGPSPIFLWLAGMALLIAAVGAASALGAWAVVVFVAGIGALGLFALRQMGRAGEDVYLGPNGETVRVPGAPSTGRGGDGGGWVAHGDFGLGGDGGGGGNGGGGT